VNVGRRALSTLLYALADVVSRRPEQLQHNRGLADVLDGGYWIGHALDYRPSRRMAVT
jgi:hypothetical protein